MPARFFLIRQNLITNVNNVDIKPGYETGHSLITVELVLNQNERGRGFRKLNTSHLREPDYVNEIKSSLKQTMVVARIFSVG